MITQLSDEFDKKALRVLQDLLVEMEARQELERYMERGPGQAPAYFCGYTRMMELRAEVERRHGEKFDQLKYHDFLMTVGPVPLAMVRRALLEDFVPAIIQQRKAG